MNWYLKVLKNYAVFDGRARRKEYWYFFLFQLIFIVVLVFVDMATGNVDQESGYGLLSSIYVLATFLPNLGVTIRRLHDTDRSGWWWLISLVPLIGLIVLLVFMAIDGTKGTNRYGTDPKTS